MDKDQALFDLGYEWRMFLKIHSLLTLVSRDEDPVRDAMVESLVLHARNLIETFYGNEGDEFRKALSIAPEKMPPDVGLLYGRACKSVVHLPPDRPAVKEDWVFGAV